MKSISDLIFSKLISFEPNINPVPREEIIDFFTKEQRFIREDHIKFLMEYGGEPLPICFKEAYITCSFKEIKELIDDEKEYGKEIPDGFLLSIIIIIIFYTSPNTKNSIKSRSCNNIIIYLYIMSKLPDELILSSSLI